MGRKGWKTTRDQKDYFELTVFARGNKKATN